LSDQAAYLLYLLFAAGGVALLLALPRGQAAPTRRLAGLLLGVAAIIGAMVLFGAVDIMAPSAFFYFFGAIALFTAARVVTHPKPVYSAVYFVALVVAVAALVLLQGAEFLAIALIIIYAGAILVTYAFVIMLAQQARVLVYDVRAREPLAAVLVGFVAMAAVAGRIADVNECPVPLDTDSRLVLAANSDTGAAPDNDGQANLAAESSTELGNTVQVGLTLFGPYVVAIQLAGILLLVGLIGAVALVRKRMPEDEVTETVTIGQIGKEVPPF
jgi:NADH-quinone oxidoreductase subunit J